MIDVSKDIHSLTDFKRNTSGMMKHIKKTQRPLILTVNGKAEAVVIDPTAYQRLADRVDAIEGIRRGLAQAKRGIGRSVDDVFHRIEREASQRRG